MTPQKDKRKGSDSRKPTNSRERNVKHPNGEEHSRRPKGTGGIRRMMPYAGMAAAFAAAAWVVANDATGIGAADDGALVVIVKAFLEFKSMIK